MKKKRNLLVCLLSFLMLLTLPYLPVNTAYAAAVEVGTEGDLTAALTAGGEIKLTADIACTGLLVSVDTTLDVNGHVLTIAANPNNGAGFQVTGAALTLTDGAAGGQVAITSSLWGIKFDGDSSKGLILKNVDLEISNATYVGMYSAAEGRPVTMDGGKLAISGCGTSADGWGAVRWGHDNAAYGGPMAFNSGVVDIENNGDHWFNFYTSSDVIFGDGGSAPLTVTLKNAASASTAFENTLQLTWIYPEHTGLTINKNATVNITLTGSAGERRGINSSGAPVVIDGGTLNIDSAYTGTGTTYGLRGIAAEVKNKGVLKIEGTTCGVSVRSGAGSFSAETGALVTVSTAGTGSLDSNETVNTITGGSVKMAGPYSIVNGVKGSAANSKVTPPPVNAAGEALTRFDLSGKAGSSIDVAADPANAASTAYTYSIGADHSGTAYAWLPAVRVVFWSTPEAMAAAQPAGILPGGELYTARGSKLSDVGGSAPAAPAAPLPGMKFLYWIDAATQKVFDPATTVVLKDTNVYPVYSVLMPATIPLDVMIDNGDGVTFINGPRDVSIGNDVYGKFMIDMSPIAAVASAYSGKTGYITGDFVMTVQGTDGLEPASTMFTSTMITDYFAGPAVTLFEMTEAPVYDAATRTITYKVKVAASLGTGGILGSDLITFMNGGIYAVSKPGNVAKVTNAIVSPKFARLKATFSGTLNFSNASHTQNFTIDMSGTQATPSSLADTTLGTYGTDPADTVSATVFYKPKTFNVNYAFVSGTTGMTLPASVTALLPVASTVDDGMTVTAVKPSPASVTVSGGTWTFSQYDAASKTVSGADVTFTGTWLFKAADSSSSSPASSETPASSSSAAHSPSTGYSSGLAGYLLVLALSAAGCLGIVLIKKKDGAK